MLDRELAPVGPREFPIKHQLVVSALLVASPQHSARVVCLPGDCIGPEVMAVAQRVLREVAPDLELEEHVFGAAAIRATGTSLPDETLAACRARRQCSRRR